MFRSPDTLPETQPWSWSGSPQWDDACSPPCRPACARTAGREWRWRGAPGHLYSVCAEKKSDDGEQHVWYKSLQKSLLSLTFVKEGDVVVLHGSEVHVLPEVRLLWRVRRQQTLSVESLLWERGGVSERERESRDFIFKCFCWVFKQLHSRRYANICITLTLEKNVKN